MSRTKKLLIVALVLAAGFGLAWPHRRKTPPALPLEPVVARPGSTPAMTGLPRQRLANDSPESPAASTPARVLAQMAGTVAPATRPTDGPQRWSTEAEFDLANHPALVQQTPAASAKGVSADGPPGADSPQPASGKIPTSRPAYATADNVSAADDQAARRQEVIHVVRNTDTLEKLARRYLGDAGRALEIFDLNRAQLSNPHLLPIGAKLTIPALAKEDVD